MSHYHLVPLHRVRARGQDDRRVARHRENPPEENQNAKANRNFFRSERAEDRPKTTQQVIEKNVRQLGSEPKPWRLPVSNQLREPCVI